MMLDHDEKDAELRGPGSSNGRRRLMMLLKIAVSAATLYFVVHSLALEDVIRIIGGVNLWWMALALVVFWLAQLVSSLRYYFITRTLRSPVSYAFSVRLHFIGLWFNQVFPTSLGGDVVKVMLLRPVIGLGPAFRTTILDRLSGFIFLLFSILLLLPLYLRVFPSLGYVIALGTFSAGALIAVAALARFGARLTLFASRLPAAAEVVRIFEDVWCFRKGRALIEQVWTSAIVHLNGIVAFALVGKALGLDISLVDYLVVVPLVFLVALIPISFAGWGLRELGSVSLFGQIGVPPEQATSMSLLFGLMLIVAGIPGIALFAATRKPVRSINLDEAVSPGQGR
jgi:uncharacterized protein (TIRG00374 family)